MSSTTTIARHRSDVTPSAAIRANVRVVRPRTGSTPHESHGPQHRGGMPPAVGTTLMGLAVVAAVAITTLGIVR